MQHGHQSMTHPMLTQQHSLNSQLFCMVAIASVRIGAPLPLMPKCLSCMDGQHPPSCGSAGRALQDIHHRGAQRLQVDTHLQIQIQLT
jgi:hypothetical protein